MTGAGFAEDLKEALGRASRIAIVGIGDECLPIDRLGIDAARALQEGLPPQAAVFLAGTVPESITAPVRRFRPDHILLIDAADMGIPPGMMAVISQESITGTLLSTHALPLSAVMEFMARDASAEVTLLGIQPDFTHPDRGLSDEDRRILDNHLQKLLEILRSLPTH